LSLPPRSFGETQATFHSDPAFVREDSHVCHLERLGACQFDRLGLYKPEHQLDEMNVRLAAFAVSSYSLSCDNSEPRAIDQ
jgi:hypothetical protein